MIKVLMIVLFICIQAKLFGYSFAAVFFQNKHRAKIYGFVVGIQWSQFEKFFF